MKLSLKLLAIFSLLLTVYSCGNYSDDDGMGGGDQSGNVDDCLDLGDAQLKLTIQDSYTTLPGQVSVFFKVTDIDGTPVPNLKAENFKIYEKGRNDDCFNVISASESKARISPNEQIFNNNTFLVLDLSNSVLSSSLDELKDASVSFIDNVMPDDASDSFKMGIYWFDGEDELHMLNDLTSDKTALINAINGITTDISKDPSTDLYGAVIKATDLAEKTVKDNSTDDVIAAGSVVIFTDGTDQASRYKESDALKKVDNANDNISFFSIGLGSEIDEDVLQKIGKTSSVFASNKEELEDTFNDISDKVSKLARSFYLFEYCSPKRDGSGKNQLVIQAILGNMQGAVQTEFDATGFTSGCSGE
ncbi:VWA domain-containing protein [Zhouia sp. PK063]|uniref:vWA domain-containing protein n=1 Tax=Zhouia sp. PK063 TaxID=3373602 RepID=UPI0037894659